MKQTASDHYLPDPMTRHHPVKGRICACALCVFQEKHEDQLSKTAAIKHKVAAIKIRAPIAYPTEVTIKCTRVQKDIGAPRQTATSEGVEDMEP